MSSSVEAGVYLYDSNKYGGIWVYLPLERRGNGMWLVDTMTVYPSGEVTCRRVLHSERYLTGMFTDLDV